MIAPLCNLKINFSPIIAKLTQKQAFKQHRVGITNVQMWRLHGTGGICNLGF